MSNIASSSTQQGDGYLEDTQEHLSSAEWFKNLRERGRHTKTVYHKEISPPDSPLKKGCQLIPSQEADDVHPVFLGSRPSVTKSSQTRAEKQLTLLPPVKRKQIDSNSENHLPFKKRKHFQMDSRNIMQQQEQNKVNAISKPSVTILRPDALTRQSSESQSKESTQHKSRSILRPDVLTRQRSKSPSPPPTRAAYIIERKYINEIKNFGAMEDVYVVKFKREYMGKKLTDMLSTMYDMFEEVLEQAKIGRKPQDRGRIYLQHSQFFKPLVVHLRPLDQLTPVSIIRKLETTLQSLENMTLDDDLVIKIGIVNMPGGGGRTKVINLTTDSRNNSIYKKSSAVYIKEIDPEQLCCARSIVTWQAKETMSQNQFKNFCNKKKFNSDTADSQRTKAIELQTKTGLPIGKPVALCDLHKFEQVVNAQIICFSPEIGNGVVYVGAPREKRCYLYYIQQKAHFSPILNLRGFFGSKEYCEECFTPCRDKYSHKCFKLCKKCKNQDCIPDSSVCCRKCHNEFRSIICFQSHQNNFDDEGLTSCDKFHRCTNCLSNVNIQKRKFTHHTCGESYCVHCNEFYYGNHYCYIQVKEPKKTSGVFYFFDFESTMEELLECERGYLPVVHENCKECHTAPCMQHSKCTNCNRLDCGVKKHVVNYAVCQSQCDMCKDKPLDQPCAFCGTRCEKCSKFESKKNRTFKYPPCQNCGVRETVFKDVQSFCDFALQPYHYNTTFISHNGGSYDEYFILNHVVNVGITPDIIYAGSRLMTMHVKGTLNIRFLDSLAFLPMALRNLPKAFGLKDVEKGDFPYFFNKKENENYIGKFPPPEMYGVDQMSGEYRSQFLHWYSQQKGLFDMREEMHKYCASDVTVLRKACTKFRQLMFDVTCDDFSPGVDVFAYNTIASVCMAIYKAKCLEQSYTAYVKSDKGEKVYDKHVVVEKGGKIQSGDILLEKEKIEKKKNIISPLAKIPPGGYCQKSGFSVEAIQWLEWESFKRGIAIQHAVNNVEERIGKYKVDGYFQSGLETTVFEYNGCVWHGCKCISDRSVRHPHNGKNMDQLLAMTTERENYIKGRGYKVVTIWQCQWAKKVAANPEIQDFIEKLEIPERLKPRDAFFGGRTSPYKLYHKVKPGQKIHYVDFTSLYPYVNKYCKYPVGHPEVITKPNQSLNGYYGIAKVDILAPRKLYFPVLPVKYDGKLIFPLCRRCCETKNQNICECTDEERVLSGTWCTPELEMAISKGYVLKKVYEVYHFSETAQYDPELKKGGLFSEYVNTFLKIKQEASGLPRENMTDSEINNYVTEYEKCEGILLEKTKIEKNPGLRSLAKLCLNSFWGKFGQKETETSNELISDPARFLRLLTDYKTEVKDFRIINDYIIQVEHSPKGESAKESNFKNIFIACFTTCHARLKLYTILDYLQADCFYSDTDCAFYIEREGRENLPLGDYLGELTNELRPGEYICEFVSTGPKAYCYRTNFDNVCVKLKGFTLNHLNSKLINFDSMKEILFDQTKEIKTVTENKISRQKYRREIYNVRQEKKYKFTFDKRVVQEDFTTTPYGY